jgi:hypothetical protein
LPLDFADLIDRLPNILKRLAKLDAKGNNPAKGDRSRPHQVSDFRSRFTSSIPSAA